jgi:hypothetical protein
MIAIKSTGARPFIGTMFLYIAAMLIVAILLMP